MKSTINQEVKDLSIITINYNSNPYTLACVRSVLENIKDIDFEVVIVDNCSEKEDFVSLEQGLNQINSKRITLVKNSINQGFGAGNMLGFEHSSPAEYILFLNNDTKILDDNTLLDCINFLKKNPNGSMCSPQPFDQNGNFIRGFDYHAHILKEIFRRKTLRFFNPNKYLSQKIRFSKPTAVDYVQGSFMMMRRKDFEEIGGFDAEIFLYYEETDLCKRFENELNKKAYLLPKLRYEHAVSASTQKNIAIKIEQKIALLYVIKKHYGKIHHWILLRYFQARYGITHLFKPKYKPLWEVLKKGGGMQFSLKHQQESCV